jgi:hypothetical protein
MVPCFGKDFKTFNETQETAQLNEKNSRSLFYNSSTRPIESCVQVGATFTGSNDCVRTTGGLRAGLAKVEVGHDHREKNHDHITARVHPACCLVDHFIGHQPAAEPVEAYELEPTLPPHHPKS